MATTSPQRALGDFDPAYFRIEWSAEDQLTRVLKDAVEVASFEYDPMGRRIEKAAGSLTHLHASPMRILSFESGSFRPLHSLDLAEGSEVELELVRIVRRKDDRRRMLLEGDEVELKLLRVVHQGYGPGGKPRAGPAGE